MGIKDLWTIVNKLDNVYQDIPCSEFEDGSVAIDSSLLFYQLKDVVVKKLCVRADMKTGVIDKDIIYRKLLKMILHFTISWLKRNITPVYCFDGKAPEAKSAERQKRADTKLKYQERLSIVLTKLLNEPKTDKINKELMLCIRQTNNSCNRDEIAKIKLFLQSIGIPCLQSVTEAEKLCSMLGKRRKMLVHSADGDCLAYRAPMIVKSFVGHDKLKCIIYNNVLEELDMNDDEFLNYCIMLGCDYNNRIRGVGPVAVKKIISQYGSIKRYARKTGKDIECLNVDECLELFAEVKCSKMIDKDNSSKNLKFDKNNLSKDIFTDLKLEKFYDNLMEL